MANGPEHYAEAERLVKLNGDLMDGLSARPQGANEAEVAACAAAFSAAQVHATLALTAATMYDTVGRGHIGTEQQELWRAAIGVTR